MHQYFMVGFTASIILSEILGALAGDLIIGNKRSIVLGGLLQASGAFSFCIPSTAGLYIGIFLVALGEGFYTPNIISHFGKLHLNRTKLLDSGFTLFYLAVNIGSFAGALIIGNLWVAWGWSWNAGFITAGVLMLFSIAFPLLSKDPGIQTSKKKYLRKSKGFENIYGARSCRFILGHLPCI